MEEQTKSSQQELYYTYLQLFYEINRRLLFTEGPMDKESLVEYSNELSNLKKRIYEKEIESRMIVFLRRYYSEAVYSNSSYLLRYILLQQFKFDVSLFDINSVFSSYLGFSNFTEPFLLPKANTSDPIESIETEITKEIEFCINEKVLSPFKPLYEFNTETALKVLTTIANRRGRIFTFEKLFLWFPDYLQTYFKNCDQLMNQLNHIPLTYRYYLAIMAVSTMKSEYLLRTLEDLFISIGGDPNWLIKGLKVVPEKLAALAKINNILAYQPWKFRVTLIEEVMKGEKAWNTRELLQACIILIFFQKLAEVVEGFHIEINEDTFAKTDIEKSHSEEEEIYKQAVKEKIRKIVSNLQILNRENSSSEVNLFKNDSDQEDSIKTTKERKIKNEEIFKVHISDFCTNYTDFDPFTGDGLSNLDFNWEDQGYDILYKYDSDTVDLINEEIEFVLNLTSNSIGEDMNNINTFLIRKALSCYIENIFGYQNKGFDYSQVNKLLHINQKIFIKNICCNPHKISEKLFNWMSIVFTKEEILHIVILSTTIKMRLQLIYISRALHEMHKKIE